MTTDADLDDLLAALPLKSSREVFDEIEAARRAAELAPPPEAMIIPMPEYPYMWPHPLGGIVRFPCVLGCGWAHDEDAFAEDREPIIVPLGGGTQDINRIFNERSRHRAAVLRGRIETAIRGHFTAAHPGREIPMRGAR
ncbi:hypothetical protein OOK58_43100 [Streptomyces sp. NBC_01728]|uniref:hypothetical protein n=1 Tax=unclassified Streptomyces TaxID=2593676 RepID=UPI00224F8DA1|nr:MULTISPECIES: hypothetical protein [unclassified Streptomyces]MCX4458701.1 hypothetical protein [Streptomyces sp. NBC_01719]MCX4498058.1 hypothetical protein [Streptomyces sp. NBC_01728]